MRASHSRKAGGLYPPLGRPRRADPFQTVDGRIDRRKGEQVERCPVKSLQGLEKNNLVPSKFCSVALIKTRKCCQAQMAVGTQ